MLQAKRRDEREKQRMAAESAQPRRRVHRAEPELRVEKRASSPKNYDDDFDYDKYMSDIDKMLDDLDNGKTEYDY